MTHSPIILFVYNRPVHTRLCIEALLKNRLASTSDLIVYSDAAKDLKNKKQVDEVRSYIHTIKGFKSLEILERDKNFGLAENIIKGVSHVLDACSRVIVLEDDLVCSPYFLDFMNEALNVYENEDQVAHVQAYCYDIPGLPETFLTQWIGSWGWATWKRAWKNFEKDGGLLLETLLSDKQKAKGFNFNAGYMRMLKNQTLGKNDSWAIRWHASCYLKGMLALNSGRSLVQNIGFDGSGTNCEISDRFYNKLYNEPVKVIKCSPIEKTMSVHKKISSFNRRKNSYLSKAKVVLKNYFN